MQKKNTNGLHKRLRLSTKYALQRSLTLEGIPITDSYKLRPYKLCLDKLRLYKLYDKFHDKLRDKLWSNLHSNNLCGNLHKRLSTKRSLTLEGISTTDSYKQHLKFLKLLYLNPCLKLLCLNLCSRLRLRKLCLASKLDKDLRSSLRSILYRQPQAIKRLKFFRPPYLKPQLWLLLFNLSKSLM